MGVKVNMVQATFVIIDLLFLYSFLSPDFKGKTFFSWWWALSLIEYIVTKKPSFFRSLESTLWICTSRN